MESDRVRVDDVQFIWAFDLHWYSHGWDISRTLAFLLVFEAVTQTKSPLNQHVNEVP